MDGIENIADDATVELTGEQLRTLREGIVEEASARAAEQTMTQIVDEARRGSTPEALRGLLVPVGSDVRVGEMRDPHRAYTENTDAVGLGQFLRAYASTDGNVRQAKELIEKWESETETPAGQRTLRALNETNLDQGGVFVQQMYSNEVIGLLRNQTVIRRAGARVIDMPGGNLRTGKITSGASSHWRGEGGQITTSQLGTGAIDLMSRELVTQTPISQRLLRHASLSFDVIVRDDCVQSSGVTQDAAFIRAVGSEYTPKGLRYLAHADNVFAPAGATLANVRSARSAAVLKLRKANIRMIKPVWLMSHRTEEFLMNIADSNNQLAFENSMLQGKWGMFPYIATNQIPDDLGTGGNESEIYLVDMFEVFIGDDGATQVSSEKNVTYRDADGNLQSAHERGEVVVQVVESMDIAVRYAKAIAVIKEVTWGA